MERQNNSRRNELCLNLTPPTFFRCPISMDVMMSPVSLCTGVTYDRSSIQTWLSQGHNTCPATMQVLSSTDFTPNLTLRRLIHHYINHHPLSSPTVSSSSASSPICVLSRIELLESIRKLAGSTSVSTVHFLGKVIDFVKFSDENRRFFTDSDGAVCEVVEALCRFTEIEIYDRVMSILELILRENGVKQLLHKHIFCGDSDYLSKFVSIMRKGSLNSRISSVRILASITLDSEAQSKIASSEELLYELHRLIAEESDNESIETGLSFLISASSASKPAKKLLLRFGIVQTVGKILSGPQSDRRVIEKATEMLALISTCTDGRGAISQDESCIIGIVRSLMKCSGVATEHGITVVWSLCCLARDRTAQEVVMRVNGLTKVLLVMQSGCSVGVREMCGDLVKVLRIKNSKSCLAGYDTKTTHIMPY